MLKAIVTEELLTIEPKFKDVLQVRNHMRLIMSSNESWSVPAGFDARRFFMPVVSETRTGDAAYFDALGAEMETGGPACLLHYLFSIGEQFITVADPRSAPTTSVLLQQKERTMEPTERFWFERLMDGQLLEDESDVNIYQSDAACWTNCDVWVRKKAIYEACLAHCKSINERYPPSETAFWTRFKKICPKAVTRDVKKPFSIVTNDVAVTTWQWAVHLPKLDDCREALAKATRQEISWQKGDEPPAHPLAEQLALLEKEDDAPF